MQFRRQSGNKLQYDSKKTGQCLLGQKKVLRNHHHHHRQFARTVTAAMSNILYSFHFTALHMTGVNHALLWGSQIL
jgi:hypothetical protein